MHNRVRLHSIRMRVVWILFSAFYIGLCISKWLRFCPSDMLRRRAVQSDKMRVCTERYEVFPCVINSPSLLRLRSHQTHICFFLHLDSDNSLFSAQPCHRLSASYIRHHAKLNVHPPYHRYSSARAEEKKTQGDTLKWTEATARLRTLWSRCRVQPRKRQRFSTSPLKYFKEKARLNFVKPHRGTPAPPGKHFTAVR